MAKTNFTKVEDALKAGIEKMHINEIGKLADIAHEASRPELKPLMEKAAKAAEKTIIERKALIHVINQGITSIKSPSFWEEVGCTQEELQGMLEREKTLKREEWQKLKKIKEIIMNLKKKELEEHPENRGENLVEAERKRHLNKRFNVREKWLPLK